MAATGTAAETGAHDDAGAAARKRALHRRRLVPYALCAPAMLALVATVAGPIGYNMRISLYDWSILMSDRPERFVGFGNYQHILGDASFRNAIWVTTAFTVIAVALEFLLGLAMALMVNEQIKARRFVRTFLIAPVLATPIVIGLVFRLIWHAEFGVANWIGGLMGFSPVFWLSNPGSAFAAIVVTEVWHNTAFVFLVLIGALQMLPDEPYEAAVMDGANRWQRFVHVTWPLLKPAILVALLFRMVFTIRLFDEIWALTRGGPQGATETISILIYKSAFEQFRMGHAAALSMILLVLSGALALVLIRTLYRKDPV
jgi:multiple sugar transport system permease protein